MRGFIYLIFLSLLLVSCGNDPVAGGTDVEVGGTIAGVLSPETNVHGEVTVSLVPKSYKPGIDADSLQRTTTVVNGAYSFTGVATGSYNLIFRNWMSSWAAFESLGYMSEVDSLVVDTVHLERSGAVQVILSELNITSKGTISLVGSDLSVTIDAGSDTVLIDGVPGHTFDEILFQGGTSWKMEEVVVQSGKLTTIPYRKSILFINDGNVDTTLDYAVYERFEELFTTTKIATIAEVDAPMVDSFTAVVLLPSVKELPDTAYWHTLSKPLMVCSHQLWVPLGMVPDTASSVGVTQLSSVTVEDRYHPILDSLYKIHETITLISNEGFENRPLVGWGNPAETGRKILTNGGASSKCPLFTYESTAKLADESIAKGQRLGIFSLDTFDKISDEGWWLYKRSLFWVAGVISIY